MRSALKKIELQNNNPPVLLAVMAHPDDETFGTGGTLALYARRGVQVYLICATRGEVGEMDPELLDGFASVADRREFELRCAAEKLGLAGVFFLGYRDSGMPGSEDNKNPHALVATPLEEVVSEIVYFIRKLHPQVVLTFDPIGGYRHPDHIAIHKATVKAFEAAGNPAAYPDSENLAPYKPLKLYYSTIPRAFLRVGVFLLRLAGRDPSHFGVNKDIDLTSIARESFPTNARIDYSPVGEIRDEASGCHESQGGRQINHGVQGRLSKIFRSGETFMRAYPKPKKGEPVERDLFAGV